MLLCYLSFLYDDSLILTAFFGDSVIMAAIMADCFDSYGLEQGLKELGSGFSPITLLPQSTVCGDVQHGDHGVLKSEISGCGKFTRTRYLLRMVCENFRG
ncbi:hypothetical protein Tco_0055815 [Tanacetum coccineum]